jgi:hypothetical protein
MTITEVDRMDLRQLIPALHKMGLSQTAYYFQGFTGDSLFTIDNVWIDKGMVERHIGPGSIMKQLEYECLTWMAL